MLKLRDIHKTYVGKVVFEGLNWHIRPGDRIGLCGPNGSGKSTLLRIIAGLIEPERGECILAQGVSIGYLPQDGLHAAGKSVFQEVLESCTDLLAMERELKELEHEISATAGEIDGQRLERYGLLQELYRQRGGYALRSRVEAVLQGLGFSREEIRADCGMFSGGWQMRIALAKLLLQQPTLLLLDEPTNHLDLDARNWLEDFLDTYPHAIVVVSHDRYFLDRIVHQIAEIEQRRLRVYPCNYSRYLQRRQKEREELRAAYACQQREIQRMERFINKFRAQASKAALVQSRIKALEKMERIELPPTARRVHFRFPPPAPSGRLVLELRGVSKRYGDQVVFRRIHLSIERGEKIALVGKNGAGKSTLLKILAGRTDFDGERIVGHNVILDYFAQDQSEVLLPENTVLEELRRDAPLETDEELRHLLGAFLFSGEEVNKPVRVLSGGERSRLGLAKLLLRGANLLLLDEPTNHLDLDAKEVLLDALQRYQGTIVFVAHDRYFLNALAQKVVEVGQGTVQLYLGDYEYYLWKKKQEGEERAGRGVRPTASPPAVSRAKAERLQAREVARRAVRENRRRQRRLEELEQLITGKEAEVESLEEEMSRPGFYEQGEAVQAVVDRYRSLKQEIEAHYREWEALVTDLGL